MLDCRVGWRFLAMTVSEHSTMLQRCSYIRDIHDTSKFRNYDTALG
jgi:hypothetical protein